MAFETPVVNGFTPAEVESMLGVLAANRDLAGNLLNLAISPADLPPIHHLVTEDDTPVDNIYSEKQQRLLTEALYTSWQGPGEGRPFVAFANVGLYSSVHSQPLVPDVMLSLDVTLPDDIWEKRHRTYMIWEYAKPPEVVIEIVSNKIGGEDVTKLQRYAQIGVAYYVILDPEQHLGEKTLRVYELRHTTYHEMAKQGADRFWLPGVELGLMLWKGPFEDWSATWLRWCDQSRNLLLTGQEVALRERQRADRLAAQLRALGIEPEES